MAKTVFSSGVIVTSEWLNGARSLTFDGQDLDWHYDPLGLSSLVTAGPDGLDSRYLTLYTNQPSLAGEILVSGQAITGDKVVSGKWTFGFDADLNPDISQDITNTPRSFITNLKYEAANGIENPSIAQKLASLSDQDLITKKVLQESQEAFVVDNGIYTCLPPAPTPD